MIDGLEAPFPDALAARALQSEQAGTAIPTDPAEIPDFEAVLMSMMVKEMRQSMGSEMFAGDKSDILGGMFDMHLGDHLAQFAKLGMNEAIMSSVQRPSVAPVAADRSQAGVL